MEAPLDELLSVLFTNELLLVTTYRLESMHRPVSLPQLRIKMEPKLERLPKEQKIKPVEKKLFYKIVF